MSEVYEADILNAGKDQVIISNDNTKVIIVPELGGRIADVQSGETRFLHTTYPEGVDFGPYTEYGGIEECIGGAPGTLWGTKWRWEQKDGGVLLQVISKGILVRKFISLDDVEALIKIEYSFLNFSNRFSKFTFGVHPEVNIGGALKENEYHVPTGGELLDGGYTEPGFKDRILPSEGWCAVTHEGRVFGQMFPEGTIDTIVVYYPKIDTHMVLEPIIFGIGVSPDRYAGFTYMAYMGDGDAEKIGNMRSSREDELQAKYEPFDEGEIPEDVMAELEEIAREQAEKQPQPVFQGVKIPQMPKMPKIQIPDIGVIKGQRRSFAGHRIKEAVERFSSAVGIDGVINKSIKFSSAADKVSFVETGRTEDLPPDTEINIEHLKGDITIHGWENQYIEHANMRGTIEQSEGTVTIKATGNFSLNVPRTTPKLSLNFVNGNVEVLNIAASMEISGVNGKIDITSEEALNDGTMNISMVHGDIGLTISADSSLSLHAASLNGDVTCDLPLQDEEKNPNRISGVLNDGAANIALNTVRGSVSIKASDEDEE